MSTQGSRSNPTSASADSGAFEAAKRPIVIAAVGIALGLAVAGSVEKNVGGAIVLGAWVLGIGALHRLGRAGSVRGAGERMSKAQESTRED